MLTRGRCYARDENRSARARSVTQFHFIIARARLSQRKSEYQVAHVPRARTRTQRNRLQRGYVAAAAVATTMSALCLAPLLIGCARARFASAQTCYLLISSRSSRLGGGGGDGSKGGQIRKQAAARERTRLIDSAGGKWCTRVCSMCARACHARASTQRDESNSDVDMRTG